MGGLDRIRPCRLPPLTFMKGRMRVKSTRTAQLKWRMMLVLTTPGLRVLTITPAKPHRQRCAGVWGWATGTLARAGPQSLPPGPKSLVAIPPGAAPVAPSPALERGLFCAPAPGPPWGTWPSLARSLPPTGSMGVPGSIYQGRDHLSPIVRPPCHGAAAWGGWDGQMALGCSPPWEPHGMAQHGTALHGMAW